MSITSEIKDYIMYHIDVLLRFQRKNFIKSTSFSLISSMYLCDSKGNCLSDEHITQVLCDIQVKRRYRQQT